MTAISSPESYDASEAAGDQPDEFVRLKKWVVEGHRARSDWRVEAARAFDFVAGWQWSEEDKRHLEENNRVAVTFNRTAPIIKAVCGLEVNNRQGIVFLPREQGDVGPDEARTAAAKWVRDECYAEDEESEAFRDCAICGEGWIETRMDYDEEKEGKIVEERVDPLEMGVNKGASHANYTDAKMVYRVREDIDAIDARSMFPGVELAAIHAGWMDDSITPGDGGVGNKKDYPNETRDGLARAGAALTKCKIVQVQWWERESVYLVAQDGVDKVQELSKEDFDKYSERAVAAGIAFTHATVPQKVYYEAFLGGSGILPVDAEGTLRRKLPMGMFQFRAMTAERDRKKKCFYGLLRDMFDPQMWANKWLSQTMGILNSNAKGGIMAETDAFQNQRKAQEDWADPTKIVWVKTGAISGNKIKDRTSPPLPQGLNDLMMFALSSLRDTTGVNLELLGQADREQAASLEMQRRQAAMTILATLFDSLRRFRKGQGKLLLHFIKLLPSGTLVRVLEKGQVKYIPLIQNNQDVKYDVIVDEAPSSPNQKQAVWAMVMQMLQGGIQFPIPTIIELLRYSPLPESVVAEIEKSMGLAEEMPAQKLKQKLEQAEQALQVMEQELQTAMEAAKTAEDSRAVDLLKLEIDEYKAETQRLAAMWTAKVAAASAATDAAVTPDPGQAGGAAAPAAPGGNEEVLASLSNQVAQLTEMMQGLMQLAQRGAQQPTSLDDVPPGNPNTYYL